jgi:hypothetical protein
MVFQVPGDGVRPGVQALTGQLFAEPDDQLDDVLAALGDTAGAGYLALRTAWMTTMVMTRRAFDIRRPWPG